MGEHKYPWQVNNESLSKNIAAKPARRSLISGNKKLVDVSAITTLDRHQRIFTFNNLTKHWVKDTNICFYHLTMKQSWQKSLISGLKDGLWCCERNFIRQNIHKGSNGDWINSKGKHPLKNHIQWSLFSFRKSLNCKWLVAKCWGQYINLSMLYSVLPHSAVLTALEISYMGFSCDQALMLSGNTHYPKVVKGWKKSFILKGGSLV